MPEYLAPGVYVEEVSFRSKSIEGVGTSTSAFVGSTRKGPLNEPPEVITSYGEFERLYGGLANLSFSSAKDTNPDVTNYMAHAVRAFFDNGGKRLYIARCFVPRTNAEGKVTSDGIASVEIVTIGANQARFVARNPGSGCNGLIRAYEKKTRATAVTMNTAPEGSLLCVRSGSDTESAAQPAVLEGGRPTFSLKNGDTLTVTTNSGAPKTITFAATSAEAIGSVIPDPASVTIGAGATLSIKINKGVQQAIDLQAGDYTLADLLDTINANLRHGYARLEGGNQLVIGTDRQGTSAEVVVSAIEGLGFDNEVTVAGTGNVTDLEAVIVDEINNQLQAVPAIPVSASVSPTTGLLNLSTTATGSSVTLKVEGSAVAALGLPTDEKQGRDGSTLSYYEKKGEEWKDSNGNSLDTSTVTNAALVTLNLEAKDADNNTIIYEGIGFSSSHPRWLGTVLAEKPSRRADILRNPYYFSIAGTGSIGVFELHKGFFSTDSEKSFPLKGGNDGQEPTDSTTVEAGFAYTDGLKVLEGVDDISILAAPGYSALTDTNNFLAVQQELIKHAECMKYRIAVLDTPQRQTISGARDIRSQIDSSFAALYYPWVIVNNPLAMPGNEQISREIALPPSGFVAGLYARTDITRGVWKAPANEVVRGALRFECVINQAQQEVLNPEGINCLRFFYGRGNRVWGARTASSDPEWKYVNIRRYFIYLEHSIDRSTQWAVFEPNGPRLWSNITDTITSFLYNEWRSGALLGAKPEQAFFVRCDRSTMTQNDLDNGRLICEIGVAAIKPAEFVIFRIGQKTADAQL